LCNPIGVQNRLASTQQCSADTGCCACCAPATSGGDNQQLLLYAAPALQTAEAESTGFADARCTSLTQCGTRKLARTAEITKMSRQESRREGPAVWHFERWQCDHSTSLQTRPLLHAIAISATAARDSNLGVTDGPIMSQQFVCILHQQTNDQPGLINTGKLAEAGCKLRVSGTCIPDLIMSRAGTTASFLLVTKSSDLHQGSVTWDRYCSSHLLSVQSTYLCCSCFTMHQTAWCQQTLMMYTAKQE